MAGDHTEEQSDGPNYFGKCVVDDYKRTIGKYWVAEMTNFNQKTLAVSFFLFFAAMAPAITFGAVYAKSTGNWMGPVEMIAATAWCGIFYSLVGGQPIMINGGTGPVLAFVAVLYNMSESIGVPFLTFNAWVGLWVFLFMIIAAFGNFNRVLKYATRFTDEIFALLIATIFIVDALGSPFKPVGVYYYFVPSHTSHDNFEDEEDYSYQAMAFLGMCLTLGTTMMAFTLRKLKFSAFCCNQGVRNTVTDFAVTISILTFTFIAHVIFPNIDTESLNAPDTFAPTFECCTSACDTYFPDDCPELTESYGRRPWFVDLFDLNGKNWVPFMAAVPAVLAFILVFLDDGITWHLIQHPSHKLTHGTAFSWDTIIIGFMIAVNSMLGLPWLVAATVRSLNHLHALGEKNQQGKFISIQETRLTSFFVHALVLASIFALQVIKLIPVAVLYGVFLFMGLATLGTNQFFQRFLMFFMESSKYPKDEAYNKYLPGDRIHKFTWCQIALFGTLYFVKSFKPISIAFPLVIAACIPVRVYLLPKIFTEAELILLDDDPAVIQQWIEENHGDDMGDNKNVDEKLVATHEIEADLSEEENKA